MARGKRWTQQENDLLMKLVKKGVTPEQILKSERFPGRTARAIDAQVKRLSIVPQKKNFIVSQITPVDIISLEEVLKLWSDAYQKLCKLERASKASLERFRIIFMAASKYAGLLADYHHYAEVEKRIERIERVLEEIQEDRAAKDR